MAMRNSVFASMLMVIGIVVLANLSGISAQFDCGGDLQAVYSRCNPFFGKEGPQTQPSQACCDALKDVDVPCLCQKYMSKYEGQVSVEKAMYVAKTCGRPVSAGFKCGSYTVPPPQSAMMH